MPFAESSQPGATRDLLALWSDVLGIVGFVFSAAGFAVTLMVNRRIREVKSQAKAAQKMAALGRFATDSGNAKHVLELAREACHTKSWDRAKGHFDIAIGQLIRLSAMRDFPGELRLSLNERVEEVRDCSKWMVNRLPGQVNLSVKRQVALDVLIEKMVELDSKIRNAFEDSFQ